LNKTFGMLDKQPHMYTRAQYIGSAVYKCGIHSPSDNQRMRQL